MSCSSIGSWCKFITNISIKQTKGMSLYNYIHTVKFWNTAIAFLVSNSSTCPSCSKRNNRRLKFKLALKRWSTLNPCKKIPQEILGHSLLFLALIVNLRRDKALLKFLITVHNFFPEHYSLKNFFSFRKLWLIKNDVHKSWTAWMKIKYKTRQTHLNETTPLALSNKYQPEFICCWP